MLAACSSGERGGAPAPARDAAPEIVPTPLDAAPVAASDAAPAAPADPATGLRAGRELARKLRWREAIAALEGASEGGDVDALKELAYVAVLAGDARRAEAASRAVLADPGVDAAARATAHYHHGRAAELRGDLAAARQAYADSVALAPSRAVSERRNKLAARRPLAAPPAPPCATPRSEKDLCACLAAELAPEIEIDEPRCVKSHAYEGGGAWAVTVVARAAAPTYLVAAAGKGRGQVIATLGDADLTISRWNVLRGPGGAALVRVDTGAAGREDALFCVTTGTPRCLAAVPLVDRVGTPAQTRRMEVAIEATDDRGLLHVTLLEGPSNPADALGTHSLW